LGEFKGDPHHDKRDTDAGYNTPLEAGFQLVFYTYGLLFHNIFLFPVDIQVLPCYSTRNSIARGFENMPRTGAREQENVKQINMRMGVDYIQMLDELCETNKRSRREVVEILIEDASLELEEDPDARLTPA
jgi:hypothetical protein